MLATLKTRFLHSPRLSRTSKHSSNHRMGSDKRSGRCPTTDLGETARRVAPYNELNAYQKSLAKNCPLVHNHHVGRTAPIDLARIRTVPQGGSWKDIPAELMPERFRKVRFTDYMTLYGRIREDHPAYTLSASFSNVTSGCFTHPREHRPFTVREGCRIQSFPDLFVVQGPIPSQYRRSEMRYRHLVRKS